MNLQVYVSYNPADEDATEALARELRHHGISLIRNYLVVPDASVTRAGLGHAMGQFDTCLIVLGPSGLTDRQRIDLLLAGELKLLIVSVGLPAADVPAPLGSVPLIPFGSHNAGSAIEQLMAAIREPRVPGTRGTVPRADPTESFSAKTPEPRSDVLLGAAAPRHVAPDSEFVARFMAYTDEHREHVQQALQAEAPCSTPMLDLANCQWAIGTKITVSLAARGLEAENSPQQFEWDGKWVMLRFDVEVPPERRLGTAILKFNITIEGITVASLRPEIEVVAETRAASDLVTATQQSPKSAFASYSTQDREYVLGRVRSLQIFTGMDVFVDCLSLRPAERWKGVLAKEILNRDVFLLFWSRSACDSPWVDWEWRTVLEKRGLDAIQPHPLEPLEVAPAPDELADLQFGNAFERFIMDVKEGRGEASG